MSESTGSSSDATPPPDGTQFWLAAHLWPSSHGGSSAEKISASEKYRWLIDGPIPRRLRNEEVTLEHRAWAAKLQNRLGTDTPSWWDYAGWTSAAVGQVFRRRMPGRRRIERALSAGNIIVYASTARMAMAIVTDTPPLPELSKHEPTWTAFLDNSKDLAKYLYGQAVVSPDQETKRRLVILANLCVLAMEQDKLDEALSVAARGQIRRLRHFDFLNPFISQWKWRSKVPGAQWLAFESRAIKMIQARRPLLMPWGLLKLSDPVGGPRIDPGSLTMPEGLEAWNPLAHFPPNAAPPNCYLDLNQRLSYLFAMFLAHPDKEGWGPDRGPTWSGAERLRDQYRRRFEAPRAVLQKPRPTWLPTQIDRQVGASDGQEFPPFEWTAEADHDWRLARDLYRRHRPWIAVAFLTRSIPASFVSAPGARLLAPRIFGISAPNEQLRPSFAGDSATRSLRTLTFVDRVLGLNCAGDAAEEVAGLANRAAAITSTREMHSGYRTALTGKASSELRANGVAINGIDTAGVAISFVTPIIDLFTDFFPRRISQAEWEPWARTWARIGMALGAPEEFLTSDGQPLGVDKMAEMGRFLDGEYACRNHAGIYLTKNFVNDLNDIVPRFASHFVRPSVAAFGDEIHTQLLMVHQTVASRALRSSYRMVRRVPMLNGLAYHGTAAMLRPILASMTNLAATVKYDWRTSFPPHFDIPQPGQT